MRQTAMVRVLFLLAVCFAAVVGPAAARPHTTPITAAITAPACLLGPQGQRLAMLERFCVLPCLAEEAKRIWVLWSPRPGARAQKGYLPKEAVCLLPGAPAQHKKRIALLKKAGLQKNLADRLLAGRIEAGDFFNYVEMAWGKPQRSFMVNYFQDEQHYVYFRPNGEKGAAAF